jgi:hypothetical protein
MLELSGDDIAILDDKQLRLLIRKLAEAELRRAGQPLSSVMDGGHQLAPDGGVDVRVGSPAKDHLDFIPRAATVFQSKAEDMTPAKILKEMRPGGELRQSIVDLIAQGGAYVIVSSKGSVADRSLQDRIKNMNSAVSGVKGASQLELRFYDRTQLARWVRQYPGVELWVREVIAKPLSGWQCYGDWARSGEMSPYLADKKARLTRRGTSDKSESIAEGITRLRDILRSPGRVVRLIGLSGSGKTRLIQALFEPNVADSDPLDVSIALYTDLGHGPLPNARDMLLQLGTIEQRAIVIVDNCNPQTHADLTRIACDHAKQLSLLTVEYDVSDDDEPEATDVFELALSSDSLVEEILELRMPALTSASRHLIAQSSGGNSRIALALARTSGNQASLNDKLLFERLLSQGRNDTGELKRTAEVCSLVYSFDGENTHPDTSHLSILAGLVQLPVQELFRNLATLRSRDMVQTRSRWRAVLPPAFANRLAKQALQNMVPGEILKAFDSDEHLLKSLARRLSYLHDSSEAQTICQTWLARDQWLGSPATLNDLGRHLFFRLAPVLEDAVLDSLERALGDPDIDAFIDGQKSHLHEWMSLLRKLTYRADRFNRAIALLSKLAARGDFDKTNLKDIWTEVFGLLLSGTHAPPAQRAAYLNQLLASDYAIDQKLAFEAIEASLKTMHFTSSHDFEFGAHQRDYGWEPKNGEDLQEWFQHAFALLRRARALGSTGRNFAERALAGQFRSLWRCTALHDELERLVLEFNDAEGGWPVGWPAMKSTLRLHGKGMPEPVRRRLETWIERCRPTSLLQQIRLLVVSNQGYVDATDIDDVEDAPDDHIAAIRRAERRAQELGELAADDIELLEALLPELLASDNGRQGCFGLGLAKGTSAPKSRWEQLLAAYLTSDQSPELTLLSGYLAGLREVDSSLANETLDGLISHPVLGPKFPALLGSLLDDSDGDRLLRAIQAGLVRPFRYGVVIREPGIRHGLSVQKYCEVLVAISKLPHGLASAIDTIGLQFHILKSNKVLVPREVLAVGRAFIERFEFDRDDHTLPYHINELAEACLFGEEGERVAQTLATNFVTAVSNYKFYGDSYVDLACTLFKRYPRMALTTFLHRTGPKAGLPLSYSFSERKKRVVECAPIGEILAWVTVDPAVRAPLVAAEIEILGQDEAAPGLSKLASELLKVAPDREAVLRGFTNRFHPSGWSGSLELTLRPYQQLLEALLTSDDPQIAAWASYQLACMKKRIRNESVMESIREERFEN